MSEIPYFKINKFSLYLLCATTRGDDKPPLLIKEIIENVEWEILLPTVSKKAVPGIFAIKSKRINILLWNLKSTQFSQLYKSCENLTIIP